MKIKIHNELLLIDLKLKFEIYNKIYLFLLSLLILIIFTMMFMLYYDEDTAVIENQNYFKVTHLSKEKKSTISLASSSVTVTTHLNSSTTSSIVNTTISIPLNGTSQHSIVSSPTKVILFYTDFYGYPYWQMGKETHTETDLKNLKCRVTKCILTHDRKYLKRADFVTFHLRDSGKVDIPKTRNNNQSYVMFTIESPDYVGDKYKNHSGIFNLTMTYRLDSDIHMRYGIVKNKLTDEQVAPNLKPLWNKVDTNMSFGK